jgi:uncharacterized protein YggE
MNQFLDMAIKHTLQIKQIINISIMKVKILTIFFLLSAVSSFSQQGSHVLHIQGQSTVSEFPELMMINVTLKSKNSVYSKCADLLRSYYGQLERAFVINGVSKEKLKPGKLHISKSFALSSGLPKTRIQDGYSGSVSVLIELPYNSNSLKSVIKTLEETEFPTSYSIYYKLSNEQKDKLLKWSIELAISDAKKKAKHIAATLNIELSKIKKINFGFSEETDNQQDFRLSPEKMVIKKAIGIIWNIEE